MDDRVNLFNKIYQKSVDRTNPYIMTGDQSVHYVGLFVRLKINKSISELKKCLELVPNHINSMFIIGKCYQALGNDQKSVYWFEKAMKINFNELTYDDTEEKYRRLFQYCLIEASVAYAKLKNFEKAIKYTNDALKHNPTNVSLLGNQTMNLIIVGRDKDAEEYISRGLSIKPDDIINNKINQFLKNIVMGKMPRPTAWNEFKDY